MAIDADVTTLINLLSENTIDATFAAEAYEDVVGNISRMPVMTNFATNLAVSSGVVTLPTTAVAILAVFYNNQLLGELSEREANWVDQKWASTTGNNVYNYIRESFNQRQFQLIPIPTDGHTATVIYTETRTTLLTQLKLPVALLILAKFYRRESLYRNTELSAACEQLGTLLLKVAIGGHAK